MKRIFKLVIMAVAALVALSSCTESQRKKALLPNVSGKAGEVVVVIGKMDWEGALGTAVRDVLAADCPYLPQKEPLYTLVDIVPSAFTNIFKVHRNILAFNIDANVVKPGVELRTDVWATPQIVIMVNVPTSEEALRLFNENSTRISSGIEQVERDRVIANTKKYSEASLYPVVKEAFGGSMYFPSGYNLKKKTRDFIWISYETTYTQQGIFIYRYPVVDDQEFTVERIVQRRNEVMKENVPGMFEDSYMITAEAMPGVDYVRYKGRDLAQTRGLWEVHKDFMGGPFVSHSFYSPDGKDIIVTEAYVYAPKYDKRHYLRQVESLLYSWEWSEDEEKK